MDVDLLLPGTVPIAPDTILWFEFLLNPNLLKTHLNNPCPEPSGTDLILEFLSVDANNTWKGASERAADLDAPLSSPSSGSPGSLSLTSQTRKQLALKILALKTAATLNWNLDTFESKLTPTIQLQLVQDLVYMATDGAFSDPQDIQSHLLQKPQVEFALILYHRWILRFPVKAALQAKSAKLPSTSGIPLENAFTLMNSNFDKILRMSKCCRAQSIRYLEEVLLKYELARRNESKKIKVPIIDVFVHLTEDTDEMNHDWEAGDVFMSEHEQAMQIHFDLCYNYFFYGQHDLAKKHILGCRENYTYLEAEISKYGYGGYNEVPWGKFNYASMSKDDIIGYIRALNLSYELLGEKPSLLQRFQDSISNLYTGIIPVLQADNLTREIPMVHRQVVELDIQSSASSGAFTVETDLLIRVSALNAVRYTLEGGIPSTHPDFLNKFKTEGIKFFDLLLWAMAPVLTSSLSEEDWENLRTSFIHLGTSTQCKLPIDKIDEYLRKHVGEAASWIREKLICDEHLQILLTDQLNADDENMVLPRELLTDDWEVPESECATMSELKMGRSKRRLIEVSTADDVRKCLVKLAKKSPPLPLWKLNPYCKPIGNAGIALASLPRGFVQDFGYVISGAARARAEAGDVRTAISLLTALEGEVQGQLGAGSHPALPRLCRLLSWELLLLQINLVLAEWPHHRVDVTELTEKCKACIAAFNSNERIHPRPQTVHAAWMYLVNICEWESGAAPGGPGELAAALCGICAKLRRGKTRKSLPRTLWDYVLSSLNIGMNAPVKRNKHTSQLRGHSRRHTYVNLSMHHGQVEGRGAYHALLQALREPLAISVMLSVLAKIYNVLVDDASRELVIEYTNLWPDIITNVNAYNAKYVLETLTALLERNLKLYPYNISWLRLYGDVELASGRHAAALRRYMCALAVSSWYFGKRAPDEGGIARRVAVCCQALGASAQAAALCQLPDEPDYTAAFKYLAERKGNAVDSIDSYYVCMWDQTLLEASVALHEQRGEGGEGNSRDRAVVAAGALELNANNSEDIQREAAAIRRARLLRALTNQYVS